MAIITYGESKSVIGRKHANNPYSNFGISVKGSSRNLSGGGRRGRILASIPTAVEIEQIHIQDEFNAIKKTGTVRVLKDNTLVWSEDKKPNRTKAAEYDLWKPTTIRKVPKWKVGIGVSCAARGHGNGDTKSAALPANDRG